MNARAPSTASFSYTQIQQSNYTTANRRLKLPTFGRISAKRKKNEANRTYWRAKRCD